ncbi:MAG: V-type ATP synthase subunit E family protein [Clostridiaceae bacterium]|nr:V-type ATP synthase subunit E family protein [Clostridiaceae bacterium]
MAGVDNIKDKILQDAELKEKEILEKAKLQANEIVEKANQKAASRAKELSQKSVHDVSEKKRIINSNVELEMRKDVLAAKQQAIEKVFDKVLEKMNNFTDSKYEQVIFDMLMASVESGEEEVVMSEAGKKKLSADFLNKLNKALAAAGRKGNVKISDEIRDISGGFILKSQGVEINNSFESIIRLSRDEIEPKVAEIFFRA